MNMPVVHTIEDYEKMVYSAAEDYNRKDYERAVIQFEELAVLNPKNKKIFEILFYIYLKLENLDKADDNRKKYLELVYEENPHLRQPKTFDDLVQEAGDFNQIKKEFDRIITHSDFLDINQALETLTNLNILYMSRQQYDEALNCAPVFKERYLSMHSN